MFFKIIAANIINKDELIKQKKHGGISPCIENHKINYFLYGAKNHLMHRLY
jgi:hypothetical protein